MNSSLNAERLSASKRAREKEREREGERKSERERERVSEYEYVAGMEIICSTSFEWLITVVLLHV